MKTLIIIISLFFLFPGSVNHDTVKNVSYLDALILQDNPDFNSWDGETRYKVREIYISNYYQYVK